MRTLRSSMWILGSAFAILLASPVLWGQAADNPVVAAAKTGDLKTVRALIAKGTQVNEPAKDGSTALLWAAYHSNLEMTRALLTAGAKVDAPNKYGITPLLQASRTGDAPVMSALLKAGADAKAASPQGETPLMAAAKTGRLDAAKLLLEAGSSVNAITTYGEETALMWAAAEGHTAVVQALVDAKADPNAYARITTLSERKHADHPTGGFTAVMYAVRNGHTDTVRALAKSGANLKAYNGDGLSALSLAIINDRLDLAAELIELGADVNDGALYFAVDIHDATTDMRARDGSRLRADFANKTSSLDLVKLMLDKGADPNLHFNGQLHSVSLCCGDNIDSSPFFRAAVASDVEALKLMIAKGAKLEWTVPEPKREGGREGRAGGANAAAGGRGNPNLGRTALMVTMTGGRGAPLAAGPGFERLIAPPFREASNREPLDAVKTLLAAGANPNAKAPDGSTPLHLAVQARQVEIIKALVAAGSKLDAVNRDNQTPLLLAEKPEPPRPAGNNNDSTAFRRKQDSREDVIAALRQLMNLGPPPLPASEKKDGDAPKTDAAANATQGAQQ
jgi:ankyrin repeat protein